MVTYVNFVDPPCKRVDDINKNFEEIASGGESNASYAPVGDTVVKRTVASGPYTAGRIKAAAGIDPDDCITVLQGLTRTGAAPTSSTSEGEIGDFFVATDFVYFCISMNNWVRVPTSAW